MSVLSSLLGIPGLKMNPGAPAAMSQDVSTESGPRPPQMSAPHPSLAMFPEYTPEQAMAMWQRLSPNSTPTSVANPANPARGWVNPISELNKALTGGGQR